MTIHVGDSVPDALLAETTSFDGSCPTAPQTVHVAASLAGKRVVVFGLPGAFTPTCHHQHLPGFVKHHAALRARGVDEVWCVAVHDAYVMAAWGLAQSALGRVRMLGDGNGELTEKLGLVDDLRAEVMGLRAKRFALLAEDGRVTRLFVEPGDTFTDSCAEAVLAWLA